MYIENTLAMYKEASKYAMYTLKDNAKAIKFIEKAEALNRMLKIVESGQELTENEMMLCEKVTPELLFGYSEAQRQI